MKKKFSSLNVYLFFLFRTFFNLFSRIREYQYTSIPRRRNRLLFYESHENAEITSHLSQKSSRARKPTEKNSNPNRSFPHKLWCNLNWAPNRIAARCHCVSNQINSNGMLMCCARQKSSDSGCSIRINLDTHCKWCKFKIKVKWINTDAAILKNVKTVRVNWAKCQSHIVAMTFPSGSTQIHMHDNKNVSTAPLMFLHQLNPDIGALLLEPHTNTHTHMPNCTTHKAYTQDQLFCCHSHTQQKSMYGCKIFFSLASLLLLLTFCFVLLSLSEYSALDNTYYSCWISETVMRKSVLVE